MSKKNQYYKLIEYIQKNNIAKVFNFRTNKVEEYLTIMTKEEKSLQKYRRLEKQKKSVPKNKATPVVIEKNSPVYLKYKSINYYSNLYMTYKSFKLSQNITIDSILLGRYLKAIKGSKYSSRFSNKFNSLLLKDNLKEVLSTHEKYNTFRLNVINVYIILRRSNIYVTISKNNKIIRIFSPCLFNHIPKKGKKKSMSFFYTVKRTIMFITRFFFNKQRKYFLKIFFKGFQKFRRPLLSRFFFNKRLKSRCIGIFNADSEPFNGCRLRKSKRIQIRGQRKQKKRFSF